MACLINSITELPKVIEGIPDDAEDFDAFFGDYTILANGKEILYDSAAYEYGWFIYFVPKDESIDGELSILYALPSKELGINGHSGYFETLSSFSMCEKGSEGQTICGTPVCDEGKEPIVITPTTTKIGNEYAGTSDKAKPTGVPQYSIYLELDTGKFYYYDNGKWNEMPCSGGGGEGCKTATLAVTCTNPNVSEISIYYGVDVGGFDYMLNGEAPLLIEGGAVDLFVGDGNSASFIGIYNDSEVDLNLESVTGDGEIKEDEDEVKWLEVHGDCTVTLSYTP